MEERKLHCMTQGKVNGHMSARQRHVREMEALNRKAIWLSAWTGVMGLFLGVIIVRLFF